MKRSTALVAIAALLFLASLAMTIRSSSASDDAAQEEALPKAVDAPAGVAAASPTVFSYQGQLSNAAGTPITNASLPMTFRLFTTLTGGTACWSENQNVNVQNGQFSVLLGQTTAIPASCLGGTNYLELVVNGETMSPRELLASVAYSIQSNSLPENARIGSYPVVAGDIIAGAPGNEFIFHTRKYQNGDFFELTSRDPGGEWKWGRGIVLRDDTGYFGIANQFPQERLDVAGNALVRGNVTSHGTVKAGYVEVENIGLKGDTVLHQNGQDRTLHILPWSGSSRTYDRVCIGCSTQNALFDVIGRINAYSLVVGNCKINASTGRTGGTGQKCEGGSIVSGAYIEANLMTPEEMAAETIDRFEQGDLLCWAPDGRQLEKCDRSSDPLVMGVADANGKPIVLGAELIKVIGVVNAGDYLVASGTPGYAVATKNPTFGIVIGQALEDHQGSPGLILAMIRKM